jgi:hypothetical protein
MVSRLALLVLFAAVPVFAGTAGEAGRYVETGDYLRSVFPAEVPAARTLWIAGELRADVETLLGHPFEALRVRYWQDDTRSAWVLDEIGKELPITIGVTVEAGAIDNVRVLEFRESRGWEVRYPFFTDQFADARLVGNERLDRSIDGITGATLSVKAVTRIAQVALLLHQHVSQPD